MTAMAATQAAPARPGWLALLLGAGPIDRLSNRLAWGVSAALLIPRVWLANVFWAAGTARLNGWDRQADLFTYQHPVPLYGIGGLLPDSLAVPHGSGELFILNPPVAAFVTTGAELVLPILILVGLFGRLAGLGLAAMAAAILFLVGGVPIDPNVPFFDPANVANAAEQLPWIAAGLLIFILGPGRLSIDHALRRFWLKR